MNWTTGEVITSSPQCKHSCFSHNLSAPVPSPAPTPAPVSCGDSFPEAHYLYLSKVPTCYMELKEVFNKAKATSLPPHHTYDCDIDLLSGTTPPKVCFYSLSVLKMKPMKDHIDSALAVGIIP